MTHVFAHHVEPKTLEHLQIVDHRLIIGRGVETIWPIALIQSAKDEDEFAIQERPLDPLDNPSRYRAEASVAVNFIIAHRHSEIVEHRRGWRPQFR